MAKLQYWNVPKEWVPLMEKILKWNNRFFDVSVRRKPLFTSVKRKKGLTLKSEIPKAAEEWGKLTTTEKNAWKSAGVVSNHTSFQLFLRDYVARKKNSLAVPGTPSDVVQYRCGRALITGTAAGFKIKQEHPHEYGVYRKVRGKRDMYEVRIIREVPSLPFKMAVAMHTDLEETHGIGYVRYIIEIWSVYQGRNIKTQFTLNFGLKDAWNKKDKTISSVVGRVIGYTAYVDVNHVQGKVEWDNLRMYHGGTNWARDPKCDNVATAYTGAFRAVARNWEAVALPPGAFYDSIYYEV